MGISRDAWARTIIDQIGVGARMNLGARDMVRDDTTRTLMMRIGSARVLRKAIITLTGDDLYDIRIVRINRRTLDVIDEAATSGVMFDQLAEWLLTAHGRVSG